jgi:hypothetical protein
MILDRLCSSYAYLMRTANGAGSMSNSAAKAA